MRAFLLAILTLFLTGLSLEGSAQVTAVMQAKVNIISGAGFSSIEQGNIDLSKASKSTNINVKAGAFSLVSAPGTDVHVQIFQGSPLKNKLGESINMDDLNIDETTFESGERYISVNGRINNTKNLNGRYEGAITAVVEYL